MMTSNWVLVGVLVLGGGEPAPPTAAEFEVRALEAARLQAIRGANQAALEKLYGDDFVGVTASGYEVDKARVLQVLARTDPKVRFTAEELKVRGIGDAALSSGRVVGRAGEAQVVSDFRYLHVWQRRDGRWQLVAGQSTNGPPPLPAYQATAGVARRLPTGSFAFDRARPLAVKDTAAEKQRDGARIREITFAGAEGKPEGATLVAPMAGGRGPAVLFVHWYEPESPDSNRTQFLEEAIELAKGGTTSLLVDTMWSDPEWIPKRKKEDDLPNSIGQVKELSRALDLLVGQKGVDAKRIAYVGHDFGAMFGAVLAGIDRRPSAWALQAGTRSFADWYLLSRRLEGEARQKVVDELASLEPVLYIGAAAPAPVLFQFGDLDPFVSKAAADSFVAATGEPKKAIWYEAGHGLDAKAKADRVGWLKERLGIAP